MSVKVQSPPTFSQNIVESLVLLNETVQARLKPEINLRRRSNISFPDPGYVIGSEGSVEREEKFLCERLMESTINKRKIEYQVHLHWFSWNNPVTSVLQGFSRPVCGLVALCMAGHMLKKKDPSIKLYSDIEILDIARDEGYTKQGEMFSAYEYASLASKIYRCKSVVINNTLTKSINTVIEHLSRGLPVLVPYDTDRNYEPCLHKGHKAHWAILTGFVVGTRKELFCDVSTSPGLAIKKVMNPKLDSVYEFQNLSLDPALLFVYAKQGKSARQQLWSFKSLSASNANLDEVNPHRNWDTFRIPKDGIGKTLCSKSVVLSPEI